MREISCFSASSLISFAVDSPILTPLTNSISICLRPSSARRLTALAVLLGLVDAGMPAVPIRSLPILPRNQDFLLGDLQFRLVGIFLFVLIPEIQHCSQSVVYLHHQSAKGELCLKQLPNIGVH